MLIKYQNNCGKECERELGKMKKKKEEIRLSWLCLIGIINK